MSRCITKQRGWEVGSTHSHIQYAEWSLRHIWPGCYEWLVVYFHPQGLSCPQCGAVLSEARAFGMTKSSQVPDYRCRKCDKTYNVYSGTVFEGRRLKPEQVMLLVRGVVKGEQAQILANEVGMCRQTVQIIRQQIQANALALQPDNPLDADEQTETDELYQNAGKKVSHTLTLPTHPRDEPISNADMARMPMTVHRLSVPLAARLV